MIFNSLEFALFFPLFFVIYSLLYTNLKKQNLIILVASYLFYGWWDWRFLTLIMASTLVDFIIGLEIAKASHEKKRKKLLLISIFFNLGLLAFFKYYNFFIDNLISSFSFLGIKLQTRSLNIILPIGISFYTFQTMSYTIDIYKKKIKPVTAIISFAAFVSFFPQLVAGPIERATNLLPQFQKKRILKYEQVADGLKLVVWGLFKKVVIADRLAILVNNVYGSPNEYNGVCLVIATIFFAFQIYLDFSGYSDIAIGAAETLGFKLMNNFNRPYFSKSVSEFWKRWHISLSSWFRDYVYIPLGGNKCSKKRLYLNLIITFTLSGLWHGANWTYIIWGALNGAYLISSIWVSNIKSQFIVESEDKKRLSNITKLCKISTTFILICLSWIFFRARTVHEALYIISNLHTGWAETIRKIISGSIPGMNFGLGAKEFVISCLLLLFILIVHLLQRSKPLRETVKNLPTYPRWIFYYSAVLSIIYLGAYGENQFIYFQF